MNKKTFSLNVDFFDSLIVKKLYNETDGAELVILLLKIVSHLENTKNGTFYFSVYDDVIGEIALTFNVSKLLVIRLFAFLRKHNMAEFCEAGLMFYESYLWSVE